MQRLGRVLLIAPIFLPAVAQAQTPVNPAPGTTTTTLSPTEIEAALKQEAQAANGHRTEGDADINELIHPFVDKATDVPMLNRKMVGSLVDLVHNPLLTPSQQARIKKILGEFNKTPDGRMAIVVISNTRNEEINTLATEIFNQMGVGQEGKNDGIQLLLNADGIRHNQIGRMVNLMVGKGLDSKIAEEKILKILQENTIPGLKSGNYSQAMENTISAVEKLVKTGGASENVDGATAAVVAGVAIMVALFLLALLYDCSIGYRQGFPATRCYLEILRIVLMCCASGSSGSSGGGSRGGGSSGGKGASL